MARGMMKIIYKIQNRRLQEEGHFPSPAQKLGGLRRIVLRSQKRKHFGAGGQSIAEYSILIVAILGALLAMQLYLKRGIQAVIKQTTDQFATQEYEETDPFKGTKQATVMQTRSQDTSIIDEQGTESGLATKYTIDSTSRTNGTTVYVSEEEL